MSRTNTIVVADAARDPSTAEATGCDTLMFSVAPGSCVRNGEYFLQQCFCCFVGLRQDLVVAGA